MVTNIENDSPVTSNPISPSGSAQWKREYEAALRENDTQVLFKRVEIAEAALFGRREALLRSDDGKAELQEIETALQKLRSVKKEVLHFL
ncbi:MAG TPA: hypothetical protein VHS34_04725 [Terriglobales bacterium]|nr:hypothetical protein [Terriglobales bacterium]